jgi:predicted nuclease of predicted toxin-antitoxin system
MKLLLDENIPKKLKYDLLEFDVFTVQEMGWIGKQNGELLELLISEKFEVLITADKNLQNQQNFRQYKIPVLVLNVRLLTYSHLKKLIPQLFEALSSELPHGPTIISE